VLDNPVHGASIVQASLAMAGLVGVRSIRIGSSAEESPASI